MSNDKKLEDLIEEYGNCVYELKKECKQAILDYVEEEIGKLKLGAEIMKSCAYNEAKQDATKAIKEVWEKWMKNETYFNFSLTWNKTEINKVILYIDESSKAIIATGKEAGWIEKK